MATHSDCPIKYLHNPLYVNKRTVQLDTNKNIKAQKFTPVNTDLKRAYMVDTHVEPDKYYKRKYQPSEYNEYIKPRRSVHIVPLSHTSVDPAKYYEQPYQPSKHYVYLPHTPVGPIKHYEQPYKSSDHYAHLKPMKIMNEEARKPPSSHYAHLDRSKKEIHIYESIDDIEQDMQHLSTNKKVIYYRVKDENRKQIKLNFSSFTGTIVILLPNRSTPDKQE